MSIYAQSVPVLTKFLKNLSGILQKGADFADKKGIKHDDFLNARLYPDMRAIAFQVQCCSNVAKFIPERLGGQPAIVLEDNETTFEQLQARITRTLEILEGIKPEWLEGEGEVIITSPRGTFQFETKQRYLSEFALPNFFFHLSICYCIMRNLGVEVGALDYLNGVFNKIAD